MTDDISQAKQKLTELMRKARIGMFTTMTADGKYHSRPMGLQQTDFDGNLWFFTYKDSDKVHDIGVNPEVNISFNDNNENSWVSISGTAEVIDDEQKASQLWNPLLKAWFPEGLETPGLTMIKVGTKSAEYWDSPASKVVNLFNLAKAAALGGDHANLGENKTLTL
jgi:general stress protein 26